MNSKFQMKSLSFFLAWLMLCPSGIPAGFAQDVNPKDARRTSDVKAAVLKLGMGKDARLMLITRDGERVGGYVNQTQEDSFSVRVFCSGNDIPMPFGRVRGLRGLNVATGIKVSAGKGVSEKAAAGLAASEPCAITMVANHRGPTPRTDAIVALGFLAFIIVLLIAIRND